MRVWIRWMLVGAVVVVGAAATAGRSGHGEAAAAEDVAVLLSGQLVAMPDPPEADVELEGPDAAARAREVATRVPLPAGGTLRGIRWTELDGSIRPAQVEEIVQYNAACQWYRALRDGREGGRAAQIIADIPGWPALRGHATGELAAAVAADVAAGGGQAFTGVLRQCDEAHEREIAYATAGRKAGGG